MTTKELIKKTRKINIAADNDIRIIERNKNDAIKIQRHISKKQDLNPFQVKLVILKIELQAANDQVRICEEAEKAIRELIEE